MICFFVNQQIQFWFATKLQYTSFMAVSCLKENFKIGKYLLMFSIKYQCKLGTIGRHDGDLQEALMFLAL